MSKRDILLSFDTETTSNEPRTTRVVQVAAIARKITPPMEGQHWYDAPQSEEVLINTLCNPGVSISDSAREVHGISDEMVADKPRDVDALQVVTDYIYENQDRIILAGQNVVTFDIPILWRVSGRDKIRVPVIDTLICATRTLPHAATHKLGDLITSLGLGSADGAHDALADIRMVERLVEYFGRGLDKTWAQLAEWCGTGRVLSVCHFGKHKGKRWGRAKAGENPADFVPYGYARFIADKFDDITPDMAVTLRRHYGIMCRPEQLQAAI